MLVLVLLTRCKMLAGVLEEAMLVLDDMTAGVTAGACLPSLLRLPVLACN